MRPKELAGAKAGDPVTIFFEGRPLEAKRGEPLSVTLLAHGVDIASRSIKYHRPRSAFCQAGSCGQCWLRIDDVPNRPACLTPVREGLSATRENSFPSADYDIFRAADFVFPGGLDHHKLGTTPSRVVNSAIAKTARQLAGLGSISEQTQAPAPAIERYDFDLVIVGGGAAGLAAANAILSFGWGSERPRVLVVESRDRLGGLLDLGLFEEEDRDRLAAATERGATVWTRSTAAAYYRGEDAPLLVLRDVRGPEERLARVSAKALIVATGGYEQAPLIGDNDLPGHYGARAVARLALRHGVLPGNKIAILDRGEGREVGPRLAERLREAGLSVVRLVEKPLPGEFSSDTPHGQVVAIETKGRTRVKGLVYRDAQGTKRTIECDLIATAYPVSPAYELAHQAGCRLTHRPEAGGFVVESSIKQRRSTVPGIYAAGEVTGAATRQLASLEGELAGLCAAASLFPAEDGALARAAELAERLQILTPKTEEEILP